MAKKIKVVVSRNEITQNILVGIGQMTHTVTSRMTIWSEGYIVRSIKPLDRETAATQGAGLVVWEYSKKADEDAIKKAKAAEKMKSLDARIEALEERMSTYIVLESKTGIAHKSMNP